MTEHVYVVARGDRCSGATLTVHADALAALTAARGVSRDNGWSEGVDHPTGYGACPRCGRLENPGQLYAAHGPSDEDWVAVSQQRVLSAAPSDRSIVVNARGDWTDMAVADAVTGHLRWAGR